ncbi:hypothetical protein BKA70DRAFT_1564538 [Coprinopsis sp. MPI-PUGE-AT-0042]|nr:hypothetical protein BKA70DRAFT_1564538 [Coprinopsis sp. MPI-PUGE-AT-0042]
MPDVPVEVIEKIIENVETDPETLASASLLCKGLQLISQRLLFHTLHLTLFCNTDFAVARLKNLLASSRLISYWLEWTQIHNALLVATLELLENRSKDIRYLSISNKSRRFRNLAISQRSVACIETLAQSPFLHTLTLCSASVELLRFCGSSLKHLIVTSESDIENCDVKTIWEPMKRTTPIILESFESHYSLRPPSDILIAQDYLLHPRSMVHLGSLKRLVLSIFRGPLWDVHDGLVDQCCHSLESLDIRCIYMPTFPTYDLHRFTNLRELFVSFFPPVASCLDTGRLARTGVQYTPRPMLSLSRNLLDVDFVSSGFYHRPRGTLGQLITIGKRVITDEDDPEQHRQEARKLEEALSALAIRCTVQVVCL